MYLHLRNHEKSVKATGRSDLTDGMMNISRAPTSITLTGCPASVSYSSNDCRHAPHGAIGEATSSPSVPRAATAIEQNFASGNREWA